jgi:outer membrane beta-barrel protein
MQNLLNSILIISFLAIWALPEKASALELDPKKIRVKPPETNIAVVQNRYFNKAYRPEIGIYYGRIMNEAYTETNYTGYRLSMFFTESLGLELSTATSEVNDSPDRIALNSLEYRDITEEVLVSPDPEVNSVHEATDASLFFTPLYGKFNVLDLFIIYSDLFVNAGYSILKTDQGDINALTYGVGQRLYFTKSFSFRWDLKVKNYTEQRSGQDSTKNSYNMDFGLCYFLF